MWYFVRNWEEAEDTGDGKAWPYVTKWKAQQSQVKWDPQMGNKTYAKTAAGAELSKQSPPSYYVLRRAVEIWLWTGSQWVIGESLFSPQFRPRTTAHQWTSLFPLKQNFIQVAPSGPRRWRAISGAWGVGAGTVWSTEVSAVSQYQEVRRVVDAA